MIVSIKLMQKCFCGNKLKKNITFSDLPLINKYTKKKVKKYPLALSSCRKCGSIQIFKKIPAKKLYPKNYQYLSSSSKEKIEHYKNYFKIIRKVKKNTNKILEVGSNDNTLINELSKKFNVTGIEPNNNSKLNKNKKVKIFNFFLNNLNIKKINKKYDIVLILNLIGSTANPLELLKNCKKLLKPNGFIILEYQNIENIIRSSNIDSIHHEHNYYFSELTINYLVYLANLKIIKNENLQLHGGIKRIILKKNLKSNLQFSEKKLIVKNELKNLKKIKFIKKNNEKKYKELFKKINNLTKNGYSVQGIGAAPRAVATIVNSKINESLINYIGETNKKKLDLYLPGTKIKIKSEKFVLETNPDFLIIFNWHLSERIIKSIKKKNYRNKFILIKNKIKIVK